MAGAVGTGTHGTRSVAGQHMPARAVASAATAALQRLRRMLAAAAALLDAAVAVACDPLRVLSRPSSFGHCLGVPKANSDCFTDSMK